MTHDPGHKASQRQREAADPTKSTWLAANAGSGKTRVLIDRVAHLLLNGVQPQRILCLTFTKAAASEMQNRLFQRLGTWAMLEEGALRQELQGLGVRGAIDADHLRRARQLFARAIESPGGLKIQTIHSFCAQLLRRFPLEAGVSPDFTEMDDRGTARLRDEVLADMASDARMPLLDGIARLLTDEDANALTNSIIDHRTAFATPLPLHDAMALFDLPAGFSHADLAQLPFDGAEQALFNRILPILSTFTKTMADLAQTLGTIDLSAPTMNDLATLFDAFLYRKDGGFLPTAKIKSIPTPKAAAALADDLAGFHALMDRVAEAREKQIAYAAALRTHALHAFATGFLPDYEHRKAARGWLDFEDLILRAIALLTDPAVAQWVLFRLDGGIDHILVDEAQDTNPEQWQVITLLAAEFTAGSGARDLDRTIFVVGDRKQSIYSFQGADLGAFDNTRKKFASELKSAHRDLLELSLDYSFRSSPVILRLVDETLKDAGGGTNSPPHLAFNLSMPGRVDLWPVVLTPEKPSGREWFDPVDILSDQSPTTILARAIAGQISTLIKNGTMIGTRQGMQRLHEGHVLILLQRRSPLFAEIIRACKSAGLAIAGADRLRLSDELAARDILALLQFLSVPEDDLSLAAALRSPLLGWTEAALYALAQPRSGTLWDALRHNHPASAAVTLLQDLRDQVDYLRPYDLIERLLTRHHGRHNLLARLGPEAEDAIDELLNQSLAYETSEVPSLGGFIGWISADSVEVKRQPGGAARSIRVMTVHGAKGLEAPLVILPDTAARKLDPQEDLFRAASGRMLWKTAASEAPRQLADLRERAREANVAENLRLLYVAMTRAESWLIVAGAGDMGEEGGGKGWYDRIAQGFDGLGASGGYGPEPLMTDLGTGRRLSHADWPVRVEPLPAIPVPPAAPTPEWLVRPAPRPAPVPVPLSPSNLGGAKALFGEGDLPDAPEALVRGTHLHLLLEHLPNLPPDQWPGRARDLLADTGDVGSLLAEASAVLLNPDLHFLFGPGTLAEVGISANLPVMKDQYVTGVIDRLVIRADHVLAVDYKSNALVPGTPAGVPQGLLRQIGAYAAALAQVYPDRRIDSAILWTRTATLMPLPPDLVMAALRSTIP